jgi:hypothetical protein
LDRQIFVDRLLETENLTDQLEDEDANSLLNWGIAKIDGLIEGVTDHEVAGEKINRLMHVMRSLNSLAGNPSGVSTQGLVELLNRYDQIVNGTTRVDEAEHRSVVEKISKMQPGEAIRFLTEWLQTKKE